MPLAAKPGDRARNLPRGQLYFEPLRSAKHLLRYLPAGTGYGELCRDFEAVTCRELESQHAFVLPHARVALYFLLKAMNLPRGSEVLMTPVTIPDIVNVIVMCGLRPVFVDLGEQTCNIDCDALENRISSKSKVLLITHLCGFPSDMGRLMAIAKRHDLEVLEDCSQVMGATHGGRRLGLFGRAGFFSLTTLKTVSTFQGGLVITDDSSLDRRLRELTVDLPMRSSWSLWKLFARDVALFAATDKRSFQRLTHHLVRQLDDRAPDWIRSVQRGELPGRRSYPTDAVARSALDPELLVQYSEAQAAIGLDALATLRSGNSIRRRLGLELFRALASSPAQDGLPRVADLDSADCTFWRFPFWVDDVVTFRRFLRKRGVDTAQTNLHCLSHEPAFSAFASTTPHARSYTKGMVFLPMHSNHTSEDTAHVADVVRGWFKGG